MRCPPLDLALVAITCLSACRPEPSAPPPERPSTASAEVKSPGTASPAAEKLAELRTGKITVEELPTQTVSLLGQFEDEQGWYAQFSITLPEGTRAVERAFRSQTGVATERWGPQGALEVIVRIPRGAPHDVRGWLYVQTQEDKPQRIAVIATPASGIQKVSDLPTQWQALLAQRFEEEAWQAGPWHHFASARLLSRASKGDHRNDTRPPSWEWSDLMATTTGAMALQAALQTDRGLNLGTRQGKARIALATLSGPSLPDHPFPAMISALPGPSSKRVEPLAEAVPAEFWYLRWRSMKDFVRVLDELSGGGPGLPRVLAGQSFGEDLLRRYRTQLGLPGTALAETFGPALVRNLALVGSDPYFREGTDVTLLFEVVDVRAFELALVAERRQLESSVGRPLARRTIVHHHHTIEVHEDTSGTVQQHVVVVGSRVLVSNSPGATQKILDAIDGRIPTLSTQPDFAYMLARDPQPSAGFAFLGDRFISSVVGPEQKIKELRRQLALSELLVPGYSALLYGYLQGAPPADTATLVRSGLLASRELRHGDGSPIEFTPGTPARSKWGSPSALTPLIDLPTPSMVTPQERDGYREFADEYTAQWQTFIDPIAVRLDVEDDAITMDLRMLPLLLRGPITQIASVVGDARVDVPAFGSGVQAVWAVDPRAPLRRDLDQIAQQTLGGQNLNLGWLGDWVWLGSLDGAAMTYFHQLQDPRIQLPAPKERDEAYSADFVRLLSALPIFAAAEIRNPAALVATLVALRAWAEQVAPGQLEWREFAKHGDVSIVRIGVASQADVGMQTFGDIAIYYAIAPSAFIVALQPEVVENIIDRFASGERPHSDAASTMQATAEVAWRSGSPIATILTWLLQGESNRLSDHSRRIAEILLRADPAAQDPEVFKQRALDVLGSVPRTASGRYDFALDQGLVTDPTHGSAVAPVFPPLPVPGSPVEQLIQRIAGIRTDVALDREPGPLDPPAMSFHARVRLQLQTP